MKKDEKRKEMKNVWGGKGMKNDWLSEEKEEV